MRGRIGDKTAYENHAERLDSSYLSAVIARLEALTHPRLILRRSRVAFSLPRVDWHLLVASEIRAGSLSAGGAVLNRPNHQCPLYPVHALRYPIIAPHSKLVLGYKGIVLSKLTGSPTARGILIHGDAFTETEIPLSPLMNKANRVITLLNADREEGLFLNPHCDVCEFRVTCYKKAIEEDNLSLLQGMPAGAIQAQNRKGIFTVNQLSFTFRPRKSPRRAKNRSRPRYYALQAQAIREKKVFIHEKPEIPSSGRCLYFDIEGVPGRGSYYLIGALAVTDDAVQYLSFWANNEAEQAKVLKDFCLFAEGFPDTPLFHYGHYDTKALREMGRLIPEHDRETVEKILSATVNVLALVHYHIYFPLHSIRLRQVGRYLGCSFSDQISSGIESIVFREEWEHSGDQALKDALIAYNREDCEALMALCDLIRTSAALVVTKELPPGRKEDIVLSSSLRKAGEGNRPVFKKADFLLPEFDTINRCAYFDYQRDRVYARSEKRVAKPRRQIPHTVRRASQDTSVVMECQQCSQCGGKRLSIQKTVRRRLLDLKFFKTGIGVKRWQPWYTIHEYRCRNCGAANTPAGAAAYADSRGIYGHNLMCWCVYHNVVGKQSMLQVERSLSDIFGLRLPYKNVYRFRSRVAVRYRPLCDEILRSILLEDVINIDETPVNLRKTTGYVWVLATADKVYYLYRESREGSFLHELLGGFSGTLVSDFFTAYDSLGCRHQKCLVHLMREVNDDLRRHPFDEDIRFIAQVFADFLIGVVSTIDRWGLTRRHLHKHLKDADRLLQRLRRKQLGSEQSIKYRKRFEKYADSLFTFLRYDNVPWNNNIAEHAVHYFAKVRRFNDGTFTSSSLEELLTLITVIQTCEYSAVNPLRFLLSGETTMTGLLRGKDRRTRRQNASDVPIGSARPLREPSR